MAMRRQPVTTVAGSAAHRRTATDAAQGTGDAATACLADAHRVAALERELESLGLRLLATRLVVKDMSQWVNDDDGSVDLVIEDLLRCWQERDRDGEPAEPGGLDEFWERYAKRVEFASSGSDQEMRAECCPDDPTLLEGDGYYYAVWGAHVAQLSAATGVRAPKSNDPAPHC
jgi:hypothetical protein